jgi:hypothetical protein
MKCQDYLNLSDTAKPISNYELKTNEYFDIPLFMKKNNSGLLDSLKMISDTLVNSVAFRRVKLDRQDGASFIYYFDCRKGLIFDLSPNIADYYPNCEIMRTEAHIATNPKYINVTELNLIKGQLHKQELTIFQNWEGNAKETKMPVSSYSEVRENIDPGIIMLLYNLKEEK